MIASNHLKETLITAKQPIYGVTTGFGDSCKRQVSPEKTIGLQRILIHFLLNGVGSIANEETTRANMLVRANWLVKEHSGIRPIVVQQLIAYINRGILPFILEKGSLGASGDLVPFRYIALALIGEGAVLYKKQIRNIKEGLSEEGLKPMTLEAEELALVADVCTAKFETSINRYTEWS
ncbi:aromatic amino acid lyase [Bacillus cereus group sp. BfR-BA-01354]|uniref:aromatic amino acid lyase n=1 Tax=Bacillus cereus group sp. BfR-BA-01354 TaxID=2920317 RepID=UPI001F594C03